MKPAFFSRYKIGDKHDILSKYIFYIEYFTLLLSRYKANKNHIIFILIYILYTVEYFSIVLIKI